jgi:hypothetical protein
VRARLVVPLSFAIAGVTLPVAAETPTPSGASSALPGPRRVPAPSAIQDVPAPDATTDDQRVLHVGAGFFAIAYGGTALAGALLWGLHAGTGSGSGSAGDSTRWSPLLVPVVGPLISMGTVPTMRSGDGAELALLLAATQGGALALFIGGAMQASSPRRAAFRPGPTVAIGPGGGSLRWSF